MISCFKKYINSFLQSPAQQVQVSHAHQHVHLDDILHQPTVAGSGESKLELSPLNGHIMFCLKEKKDDTKL